MTLNLKNQNVGFVERTEVVKQYFKSISKYKILTQEEELELFRIIKEGSNQDEINEAKHKLIVCNQLLVCSVARKLTTSDQFLDCVSEGSLALLTAIEKFDPNKGVRFSTYATPYIYRDISQYLRDMDPSIKKTNVSKTYHYIPQAVNKFIQTNEREPTDEELMEILNTEYNQNIKDPQDVRVMTMFSIDEDFNNDSEDEITPAMYAFNDYSAVGNDYESEAEKEYNKEFLSTLLTVLTPREQTIIKKSFGIGESREYEAQEIADEIGLTPERVRQLKNSAMKRLQEEFKNRMKKAPLV